jgi:hypothetical protein
MSGRRRGTQEGVDAPAGVVRIWPVLWTLAGVVLLPLPLAAQAPGAGDPASAPSPMAALDVPTVDPSSAPQPLAAQTVPAADDEPIPLPLLEPVTPMSEWAPAPERPPRHLRPTVTGAAIGLGVGLVLRYAIGLRLWAAAGGAVAGALIGSSIPGDDDGPAPRFDARVGSSWSVSLSVPTGGR